MNTFQHFNSFLLFLQISTSKSVSYFRLLNVENRESEVFCNHFKAMEIVEIGKLLDVCRGGWKGEQFDMKAEAESKTTPHFL